VSKSAPPSKSANWPNSSHDGQRTLAERAGISEATIRRGEATDQVPTMRSDNLAALQRTMEVAGILFLDEGDVRTGGPGVRLRRRS
jgi:hypothetical protein